MKWKMATVAASILAGLALVAAGIVVKMRPQEPTLGPSMHLTITLPPDMPLAPAGIMQESSDRPALALSPDGSRLAYVAQIGSKTRICVRNMTDGKVLPLAGTEEGHTPFFSPNGAFIAFFAAGKLRKTPSSGGSVTALADAPSPFGGTWGVDGNIYFNRYEGEGICQVAENGGPTSVFSPGQQLMPEPGVRGKGLLVRTGTGSICYVRAGGTTTPIVDSRFGGRLSPTGHLIYAREGRLVAARLDTSAMKVAGPSVEMLDDLRTAPYGVAQFALAQDGTLVYASGHDQMKTSFVWVDRRGNLRPLGLPEDQYSAFKLSPDGKRLALVALDETKSVNEIWIYDLVQRTKSRLTPRAATGAAKGGSFPLWTPDDRRVVYLRRQGLSSQLILKAADGGTEEIVLWSRKNTGPEWLYPMSFSPDGSVMVVFGPGGQTSFDQYLMRFNAGESSTGKIEPELFQGSPFGEGFGQISRDGRWMLYASDESGKYEICVTTYPKPGAVYRVSRNGGLEPRWNPAGPEIVYLAGSQMYAVDVSFDPEFRAGEPRLLFEGAFPNVPGLGYDITPDGREFLMLENKDFLKPSTTLTVVTNFFDELRRRVRPGK